MNIFVGNLAFSSKDSDIRSAFEAHGEVASARVVSDRETGRSRGFGFIEMANDAEARAAIAALDGADLDGRALKVNEARPKEDSRGGSGGGGRSGGGYGGGSGGGYGSRSRY